MKMYPQSICLKPERRDPCLLSKTPHMAGGNDPQMRVFTSLLITVRSECAMCAYHFLRAFSSLLPAFCQ